MQVLQLLESTEVLKVVVAQHQDAKSMAHRDGEERDTLQLVIGQTHRQQFLEWHEELVTLGYGVPTTKMAILNSATPNR